MALKVMICDDAGFVREILTQAILELGHQVVGEARDGVEAVRIALKLKPDVVLMDLVLPLKNGAEAARDIKAGLESVKIVVLSTVDEDFLRSKAEEIGCDAYLPKPFTKMQLKVILDLFGARRREAQNG